MTHLVSRRKSYKRNRRKSKEKRQAESLSFKDNNKPQARQDLTEEITKEIHLLKTPKGDHNTNMLDPSTLWNKKADHEVKGGLNGETQINTGLGEKIQY